MRKLAVFTFSFGAAVALCVYLLPRWIGVYLGATLLLLGVGLCFIKREKLKPVRLAALGLAFGCFWSWAYACYKLAPVEKLCGEEREILVQVRELPVKTSYGSRVVAELDGVNILLYLDEDAPSPGLGDQLRLQAKLKSYATEGEENLYYEGKDILLLATQTGEIEHIPARKLPLRYWPQAALQAVREKLDQIFPEDTRAFAQALVTGDTSCLSYETRNSLSVTGISHVVAVSGMHVSMIVSIVMLLSLRKRRLAAILSIAAVLFFAAMLGFTPSVTRSAVMQIIFLLAPFFKRESDGPTALGLSLFLILLENPWAIASLSLQLSYGSVAGILLFTTPVINWGREKFFTSDRRRKYPRLSNFLEGILIALATCLGAMVFTAPLVALKFEVISIIGPITNLLCLSVLNVVFMGTCVAVFFGFLWQPIGQVLGWILSWGMRYVLWTVGWLKDLPYAAVYTNNFFVVLWVAVVYLLLAVFLWRKPRRPLLFFCGILCTFLCAIVFSQSGKPDFSVTMLDVGQGQCILLRSGNMTAMVDCGGDYTDEIGEKAARTLLMQGEERLDVLLLTHYDLDHSGGVEQLLSRIPVGQILLPDIRDEEGDRERILGVAEKYKVGVCFVSQDTQVDFSGGKLLAFAPPRGEEENTGLSALMSVEEYDILITGDMNHRGEQKLLALHDLSQIEILVAGHHGSKYSTSRELLQKIQPQIVLISVGENSYGHPAAELLERIDEVGAVVYRTDMDGEITITR